MTDRCYWLKTSEVPGGKVLIPGCWNRVIHGDDAICHCPPKPRKQDATILQELSERVAKLEKLLGRTPAEPSQDAKTT